MRSADRHSSAVRLLAVLAPLALTCALIGCGSGGAPAPKTAPGKPRQGHRGAAASPGAAGGKISASAPGAHRAPREAVPILMYHVIDTAKAGTPLPELWVPREEFRAEVEALAARGYRGVTVQQVWDAWHHGGLLPAKPIVFSFDDGYDSQFTNALPILREHGWPGVLNLEVATLHTTLRPAQVRGMITAGWEVDAHTMTHPDLTTIGPAELQYEVAESRRWIRSHFHVPVNFFCYPAGRFDPTVEAAVKAAGYLAATTTNPGLAAPSDPPYELRRIRVNAGDGVPGLLRSLTAAQSGATSNAPTGE